MSKRKNLLLSVSSEVEENISRMPFLKSEICFLKRLIYRLGEDRSFVCSYHFKV